MFYFYTCCNVFLAKSQGDVDYEKKNDANDEEVLPKGVSPEDLKASELHYKDRELIEKLEKEHEQKLKKQAEMEQNIKQLHQSSIKSESLVNNLDDNVSNTKTDVVLEKNIPLPSTKKYKPKQQVIFFNIPYRCLKFFLKSAWLHFLFFHSLIQKPNKEKFPRQDWVE